MAADAPYELLFALSPNPMWVFDAVTYDFLAVNEAAIRHYGYTRDEFLTMKVRDIRPPEDVAKFLEFFTQTGPTAAASSRGEWRHLRKDGSIIDVEIRSTTVVMDGRQGVLSLVEDVTERKRAERARRESEEALRRSEANFRALIEHLPTAVLVHRDMR